MTPIIYAATAKECFHQNGPPELRAECKESRCERCGTEVIVVKNTMERTEAIAAQSGRTVKVVCLSCFEHVKTGPLALLFLPDKKAQSLMRQHRAEMN